MPIAKSLIQRKPGGPSGSTGDAVSVAVDASNDRLYVELGGEKKEIITSAYTYVGTDVTLAGTPDYLTIDGPTQVITRGLIDLTTDVTGVLPEANGGANGASVAYPKTSTGANTLLASVTGDRHVIISVQVTEVFANGSGGQTVFSIGQTGSASKFAASSLFTGAAVGATFSFGGVLTTATALLITATAASGTGTGAITVTAITSA